MAKQAASLEAEFQKILNGLGDMPGVVGELGNVVARLAAAFNPLQNAISRLLSDSGDTVLETAQVAQQSLLVSAVNRNSVSTDANTAATTRLSTLIGSLNAMISGLISRMNASLQRQGFDQLAGGKSPLMLAGGSSGGGGAGDAAGGLAAGGMSSLGKLAAVAGVAAAAIGVLVVGINLAEQQFQKIVGLVKLFNPAVVQAFQFALDNLGATIGRAFVPVIQVAAAVVREWTAALAPVIQALVPIVQEFSQVFGELIANGLRTLASVLMSSVPIIRQVAEMLVAVVQFGEPFRAQLAIFVRGLMLATRLLYELSGMGIIVRVLTIVMEAWSKVMEVVEAAFSILEVTITTVVDSIMTMVSSIFPFKDVMDQLTRAVQFAIRNLYVFSVMLAKFLGFDGLADALIASVEGKTRQGDTAAQSPQIKSLEQLSKDLALAAATSAGAAGQGGVRNQQEFWQKTLEEMRVARANGGSMVDILREIRDALKRLANPFGGGANPPVGPANPGVGGLPPSGPMQGPPGLLGPFNPNPVFPGM